MILNLEFYEHNSVNAVQRKCCTWLCLCVRSFAYSYAVIKKDALDQKGGTV